MRRPPAWLLLLALLLSSQPSQAQEAGDKAAAETLFREAAELMTNQQLEQACEKYHASQQLDPALGTLLRLADCYDRIGRTASAWALFVEGEAAATRAQQTERAELAATRAQDLEQRLSRLTIELPAAHEVRAMTVTVNGRTIPRASWGSELPFDPGVLAITASAPGYQDWSSNLELPEGPAQRSLTVPRLTPVPVEAPQALAIAHSNTAPAPLGAEPDPPARTQAVLGYVIGGAGVLGLAAAGALGYRAYSKNQASFAECAEDDRNACTETGKQLRDEASDYGSWATLAGGIGAGLVVTGLVLVVTSPDSEPKQHASAGLELTPRADATGAGLWMRGSW